MNKRNFLKTGAALGAAALAAPYASQTIAQSGPGYQVIDPPLNKRVSDKVEVTEIFWFGCPHCFRFEPAINEWKANLPDYVEFQREAPPLNNSWEPHSRAFYAAELMGVTDQFFDPMFNAIHVAKRPLRSPKQIVKFVDELGIDSEKFSKTMDSFATNTRMNQAMQMAAGAGLSGVPSIIVNGKYLTGGSLAGSNENVIRVIDGLVAKEYEILQAG